MIIPTINIIDICPLIPVNNKAYWEAAWIFLNNIKLNTLCIETILNFALYQEKIEAIEQI